MKYNGTINKILYDNNKGWCIILVELINSKNKIKAVGFTGEVYEGMEVEIDGHEEINEYGKQISIEKFKNKNTNSINGIKAYLASGIIKGIGKVTADKIVSKFKEKTLEIIESDPIKLTCIKGISKKKALSISEQHKNSSSYLKLYDLLDGNITINQAKKITEKYGEKSIEILKKNPYILIYDVPGFGFFKADSLALTSSHDNYFSINRVRAACIYTLNNMSELYGHCFITLDILAKNTIPILSPANSSLSFPDSKKKTIINSFYELCFGSDSNNFTDLWEKEKENFRKRYGLQEELMKELQKWHQEKNQYIHIMADAIIEEVKQKNIVLDGENVYLIENYRSEENIAKIINKLIKEKSIKNISDEIIQEKIKKAEEKNGYALGEEQKLGIQAGIKNKLTTITGGPGRGKSTIIEIILDIWDDDNNVVLCAPTGRAAQRMKEITGRKSSTIHSLILSDRKISNCLVVCDESTMVDINLASKLLKFIENNNQIIFIGDIDQLPSIGPGCFFKDLINNQYVPTVRLITGYRNFGSIAENCTKVLKGQGLKHWKIDDAFKFIPAITDNLHDIVLNKYLELRKKYKEEEICILTGLRVKRNSSSDVINELIKNTINPNKANDEDNMLSGCNFKLNDRIMQRKNDSSKDVYIDCKKENGIYNGDCGKIIEVDTEEQTYKIRFDEGKEAYFQKYEMDDMSLAYAMTIHKSQGSEYKAVILVIMNEQYIVLERNLLYTAISRAKKEITVIGEEKAISTAVRNIPNYLRNTKLLSKIKM